MRRGGGKSKGAGFEREICKRLSLWVSRGTKQDVFWRSAMSGGRSTVARKKGTVLNRQAGDITATAPEGHQLTGTFFIECKFYKDLQLRSFLLNLEYGKLWEFWDKALEEAFSYGKEPLLIAKQNLIPTLVLVTKAGAAQLGTVIRGGAHSMPRPIAWLRSDVLLYWFDELLELRYLADNGADIVMKKPKLTPTALRRKAR
jgi:hypothetical protein